MGLKKAVTAGQDDQPQVQEQIETTSTDTATLAESQPVAEQTAIAETHAETRLTESNPTSTEVAVQSRNGAEFSARMRDQGYAGMELGFGAFPIIKLANEGTFLDSDETDHGKGFACQLLSTRPSYLYKQKDNNDSPVYYSYDQVKLTNASDQGSTTVAELREEWKIDGWEVELKEYIEGRIVLKDDLDYPTDYADEMFLISIAPNSRRKIAGVLAGLEFRNEVPAEQILLCTVGAKRKHGSNTYFPWAFKIKRD